MSLFSHPFEIRQPFLRLKLEAFYSSFVPLLCIMSAGAAGPGVTWGACSGVSRLGGLPRAPPPAGGIPNPDEHYDPGQRLQLLKDHAERFLDLQPLEKRRIAWMAPAAAGKPQGEWLIMEAEDDLACWQHIVINHFQANQSAVSALCGLIDAHQNRPFKNAGKIEALRIIAKMVKDRWRRPPGNWSRWLMETIKHANDALDNPDHWSWGPGGKGWGKGALSYNPAMSFQSYDTGIKDGKGHANDNNDIHQGPGKRSAYNDKDIGKDKAIVHSAAGALAIKYIDNPWSELE